MTWSAAALYAMNLAQLYFAGESEVELHELGKALEALQPPSRPGDQVGEPSGGAPQIGSHEWIEDQEYLETERASWGACDC